MAGLEVMVGFSCLMASCYLSLDSEHSEWHLVISITSVILAIIQMWLYLKAQKLGLFAYSCIVFVKMLSIFYAYIHTQAYFCMHTHTHTPTNMPASTHTHTHTHTHMHKEVL